MKLNNKGYLIAEIIVASVIAMGLAYFLLELVIDVKNKNDSYYVTTMLETDKTLMTKEVMDDVSSYKIKDIYTNNINYVDITFIIDGKDVNKRITIDKNKKLFKYGIFENDVYINDEYYFEKEFDSKLNISDIKITNVCYYNNFYVDCNSLEQSIKDSIDNKLLTLLVNAKTNYSDTDYGINININY